MTRAEISAKLRAFFEGKAPSPDLKLTDTMLLREEWFLDSLGILETVAFLEDEFKVVVTRADINGTHFATVSSLADFVVSRS